MVKVVALIPVQQKLTMSFIFLGWYKNAKYAGSLTDTVFKKSQFCCKVNKLITSSLFYFSPVSSDFFLISRTFLSLFCTCFKLQGLLDWLSDV